MKHWAMRKSSETNANVFSRSKPIETSQLLLIRGSIKTIVD
jgi:hypothetical protein